MEFKEGKTARNFELIEFKDSKGVECSIQRSSLATDECIWMGCDNADPQYFTPGAPEPWKKLEVPPQTVFNTRMHLNRKQVKALLPILQNFVETGKVTRRRLVRHKTNNK